jgi:hypothetical protein
VKRLFVVLLVVGCAHGPSSPGNPEAPRLLPPDERPLASLVPAPAEVVLSVDVSQLRASLWTQGALTSIAPEDRRAGVERRGFDEGADVDELVLARVPVAEDGALELLRGRFDQRRVTAAFRSLYPAASAADFRGVSLLSDEATGRACAFVGARTLALGPLASVRALLDTALGRAPAAVDETWLVQTAAALDDEAAAASPRPALALALLVTERTRKDFAAALPAAGALERVGLRLALGKALRATIVGLTAARSDAAEVQVQLSRLIEGWRGRTSVRAFGLDVILEGVRVTGRDGRVVASATLLERDRAHVIERVAALADVLSKAREAGPDAGSALR